MAAPLICVCLAGLAAVRAGGEDDETAADPALDAALQLQTAFARVAERVLPSVVGITSWRRVEGTAEPPSREGWRVASREGHPGYEPIRAASGTVVSADGYILSTSALLEDPESGDPADLLDVEIHGWGSAPARVIGAEPTLGLAVLKVELPYEARAAPLGDSDGTAIGHWAIALGDPQGAGKVFAAGTLSADPERECYQEELSATLLQSSMSIPPGAWGGPLVDIRGQVIGINLPGPGGGGGPVSRALAPAGDWTGGSFALPINLALTIYEPLRSRESTRSPWIGVSVRTLDLELRKRIPSPPRTGIYIDDVFDPSPASRAGLRVGDVLVRMGDERIAHVADFQRWLYLNGIGATVELELSRSGQTLRRPVRIEERPPTATQR